MSLIPGKNNFCRISMIINKNKVSFQRSDLFQVIGDENVSKFFPNLTMSKNVLTFLIKKNFWSVLFISFQSIFSSNLNFFWDFKYANKKNQKKTT